MSPHGLKQRLCAINVVNRRANSLQDNFQGLGCRGCLENCRSDFESHAWACGCVQVQARQNEFECRRIFKVEEGKGGKGGQERKERASNRESEGPIERERERGPRAGRGLMSAATQIALAYALSAGGMSPRSPVMFLNIELTYNGQEAF